ncbi:Nitrogen fixation regulation protein FixK [Variovorax boronicumulans]|uniref:Crp/Fnr family transcriptional regulator n=1 Tax=Variovorax boronicumulans TaxID=436515 RepID=UPI0015554182|nr:Crp/Fnr family transcriptional regulator [Variovorax boronicumulans]PBI91334.1 Nitrogen fixation regulation protein FixK [Variovorax boronicumulans]
MKFEDYPVAASPPQGANPCEHCALRRLEAFLPVTAQQLEAIQSFRTGTRRVEAGGAIVDEHRASPQLFTLYAGWAFRYKTLSDGRRQILGFLLPGDFIGLQDEFADGQTHGVEAVTDATLCAFARERLWALFQTQPRLGYDITWLAAREEKLVDDHLVTAGRRNAGERVAMLLMHLYRRAQRVGMVRDGWVEFPFNQQHIADALGLSLVHTNKTMRRLQRLGLYKLDGGWLRILEPHALETLGDYFERPLRPVPMI